MNVWRGGKVRARSEMFACLPRLAHISNVSGVQSDSPASLDDNIPSFPRAMTRILLRLSLTIRHTSEFTSYVPNHGSRILGSDRSVPDKIRVNPFDGQDERVKGSMYSTQQGHFVLDSLYNSTLLTSHPRPLLYTHSPPPPSSEVTAMAHPSIKQHSCELHCDHPNLADEVSRCPINAKKLRALPVDKDANRASRIRSAKTLLEYLALYKNRIERLTAAFYPSNPPALRAHRLQTSSAAESRRSLVTSRQLWQDLREHFRWQSHRPLRRHCPQDLSPSSQPPSRPLPPHHRHRAQQPKSAYSSPSA